MGLYVGPPAATTLLLAMPKYTRLLTPAEYEKLTIDEKAEYIIAMAAVLKSRIPARDPTQDATNQAQDDPAPRDATNQTQDDPPLSDDKPKEP